MLHSKSSCKTIMVWIQYRSVCRKKKIKLKLSFKKKKSINEDKIKIKLGNSTARAKQFKIIIFDKFNSYLPIFPEKLIIENMLRFKSMNAKKKKNNRYRSNEYCTISLTFMILITEVIFVCFTRTKFRPLE